MQANKNNCKFTSKKIATLSLSLRFNILRKISKFLMPSYRFKWPQLEWWNDPIFNEYLIRFGENDGMNADRRWMLYQLGRLVRNIPGDTAECGVYKGAGSYLICKLNQENQLFTRTHYVFDSFEGLSQPSKHDGEHWAAGNLSSPLETVHENLSEFNRISIHKGWIPKTFSNLENHKFCFVHIDVDLYQPTLDSIKFFYPRINEGGLIICDDYGFTTCPGATKAIDQYLQGKSEK